MMSQQQMNIVDVYDIATSTWYKQATSGSIPNMRVNPCAVVAAAPESVCPRNVALSRTDYT